MKSKNLKYSFVSLMIVIAAMSFSACGTGSSTAANNSTGSASSTASNNSAGAVSSAAASKSPASAPAATSADIVAQYTFTNTGTVELCELYLSPVGVDSWGPDQLQSQTIAVGAKFVLKNIPAGTYDAKVVGCGGAGESVIKVDIKN